MVTSELCGLCASPLLRQRSFFGYQYNKNGPQLFSKLPAISEIIGSSYFSIPEKRIIPREEGYGLFISEKTTEHLDFFCPLNTPILLCKENVKDEIEKENYTGLIFLEVGETI